MTNTFSQPNAPRVFDGAYSLSVPRGYVIVLDKNGDPITDANGLTLLVAA